MMEGRNYLDGIQLACSFFCFRHTDTGTEHESEPIFDLRGQDDYLESSFKPQSSLQKGEYMKSFVAVLALVLLVLPSASMVSQDMWKDASGKELSGFRAIFLKDYESARKKLLSLADAMPEDKYSWRPMEGVRSVSEVYIHIATDNYYLPGLIGYKTSEKFSEEDEKKMTKKAEVIEYLTKSFDFIKEAALKVSDDDLDKPADFFGSKTTYRGILYHAATHWHEHLGQSIAYARMNKIVPPWTAAEQKAEQEKSGGKK